MSVARENEESRIVPPGVCVPWEEKLRDIGEILGNEEIIKNEWEKLDAFAYIYLWWWVQR